VRAGIQIYKIKSDLYTIFEIQPLYNKLNNLPMDQISTLKKKPSGKMKRFYAKPSDSTIDFLMKFAREYVPENIPVKKNLLYN
jgi:hypothetical protein